MYTLINRLTKRRGAVIALWVMALTLLAGASFAAVGSTPSPKASSKAKAATDAEDAGVHGGPHARIHAGCTAATGLAGNWTHGDYVDAVTKAHPGDSEKIRNAAHSDCGKIDHSKLAHGKSGLPHGKSDEHKPALSP
ncbi:MAG: hypothetical protein ABR548_11145 [Actinomycetota bacterium]|nr:hypothetical protein [Actinomycetota bacterium]